MPISVIVPYSSNSPGWLPYLSLCLSSLARESEILSEILVVLNGTRDDCHRIAEAGERVRVITADKALGYGGAINLGAKQASGEFLLFCDADTFYPKTGWVDRHLHLHASNPSIGISSPKLVNYRTGRILDFGIGRTRFNHFHPFRDLPVDHPRTCHSRRVQMACSAVMMIAKDLFLKVEGFDENLRHYYQDIDLCLRLKRENREVWVIGDAMAFHRGESTNLARRPFKIDERAYFTVKNEMLMQIDFADYLNDSLAVHSEHLASAGPFGLVNLSTMTDHREATDIISHYTQLVPLANHAPQERDLETIVLPDFVNFQVLRHAGPLLFLVDRHFSLRFNALWQASRETSADLVVDRHANVCFFDSLLSN
jgi:GT2 family glycosyltransferase